MTVCKCCGQPLATRHGVKMPAKKLEIYDAIKRAGSRGILTRVLGDIIYPRADLDSAAERVRTHICQINEMLADTDWRIRRDCGRYRLIREVVEVVA